MVVGVGCFKFGLEDFAISNGEDLVIDFEHSAVFVEVGLGGGEGWRKCGGGYRRGGGDGGDIGENASGIHDVEGDDAKDTGADDDADDGEGAFVFHVHIQWALYRR